MNNITISNGGTDYNSPLSTTIYNYNNGSIGFQVYRTPEYE